MFLRLASLALVTAAAPALAQSVVPVPTALPFLEISPTPAVLGLGGADVAYTGAGAYAAIGNPALAGLAARDFVSATAGGPGATDWRAFSNIRFSGGAQAFGLAGPVLGLPVNVGAAATWTMMDYGDRTLQGTSATYTPADRFASISVGAATLGAVRFAAGGSLRYLSTTDAVAFRDGGPRVSSRHGLTADLGLAAEADVAALAGSPSLRITDHAHLAPTLDVTAGYAQTHLGGTMTYTGGEPVPLPRTARLGWATSAGLDLRSTGGSLTLLEGEILLQAETRLVRENVEGRYEYASLTGDVGMMDAVLGRGDETVTGRRGIRVGVLETVAFSRGWFGGAGFANTASHSLELRLAGPMKLAAALTHSDRLGRAADRLDVRWIRAVTFADSPYETTMNGFSLIIRR